MYLRRVRRQSVAKRRRRARSERIRHPSLHLRAQAIGRLLPHLRLFENDGHVSKIPISVVELEPIHSCIPSTLQNSTRVNEQGHSGSVDSRGKTRTKASAGMQAKQLLSPRVSATHSGLSSASSHVTLDRFAIGGQSNSSCSATSTGFGKLGGPRDSYVRRPDANSSH